jgi:hypothetical protein
VERLAVVPRKKKVKTINKTDSMKNILNIAALTVVAFALVGCASDFAPSSGSSSYAASDNSDSQPDNTPDVSITIPVEEVVVGGPAASSPAPARGGISSGGFRPEPTPYMPRPELPRLPKKY